jgi:hypothetical protein
MKRKSTPPNILLIAVDSLRRETETGIRNPMETQGGWHSTMTTDRFETSQEAYDTLRIFDAASANRIQAGSKK